MINKLIFNFSFISVLCLPSISFALVDYSDNSSERETPTNYSPNSKKPTKTQSMQKINRKGPQSSAAGPKFMTLQTGYETNSVKLDTVDANTSKIFFNGRFDTQYNVFLNFGAYGISSSDDTLTSDHSMQTGNPYANIGFNWLRFGSGMDASTVDLYAGAMLKQSGSTLVNSGNKQNIGLQTSKKFIDLTLALGIDYSLTGTPKDQEEMDTGNILKYSAALMWDVSDQISFALGFDSYKVAKSDNDDRLHHLKQDKSFTTMSAKTSLQISPIIDLEMGGVFRTKKMQETEEILRARLYNMPGSYGNSLFANLNISI